MKGRCPNCGAEVTVEALSCPSCGSAQAPEGAPQAAPPDAGQGSENEVARPAPSDGEPVGSPQQDPAVQEQRAAERLAATMRLVGWSLTVIGALGLLGVVTGDLTSLLTGGVLLALGRAIVRAAGSFGRYAQDGPWQPARRMQALERLVPVLRIQFVGAVIPVVLGVGIIASLWLAQEQVGSNISVEELKDFETLYESLDDRVIALKFHGGPVACRVDVESDGVKRKVGSIPKQEWRSHEADFFSYFVWTRGPLDANGAESWRSAHRFGSCNSTKSPLNVLLDRLGLPSAYEHKEENCSWNTWSGQHTIKLGERQSGEHAWNFNESTEILSPMPAGVDVTLKTFEEEWLLPGADVPYHKHVLRVVCRAAEG